MTQSYTTIEKGTVALTLDVEDWFCVKNMMSLVNPDMWGTGLFTLRVEESTNYILEQLARRNIKATFFVLGWVAERCPSLIKKIVAEGHEIGSHGYSHIPVNKMNEETFREDLLKSLQIISSISGIKIKGYRAPSFSIHPNMTWAFRVLRECGIDYDSSVFPIHHPDYGAADFEGGIQTINGIIEVPMTTVNIAGFKIPSAGGGYFRLFPYWIFRKLLKRAAKTQKSIVYFHPWEFDLEQPRLALPVLKRFRHYVGLRKNREKFERFLDEFSFCRVCDLLV